MKIALQEQHYRDKTDHVSYLAIHSEGYTQDVRDDFCYGKIIHDLTSYEITCRPYHSTNSCPPPVFRAFFRELQSCGVIPKEIRFGAKQGKNTLVIPRQGWDYHTIFVTLSMYRHSDQHGISIVGRTMKLYDSLKEQGVHFLQCLHWALVTTNYSHWHSCINLCDNPYDGSHARAKNLKWGLALAVYGRLTLAERKSIRQRQSVVMFDHLAKGLRDFKIKQADEILDPKYAEYYHHPEKARK